MGSEAVQCSIRHVPYFQNADRVPLVCEHLKYHIFSKLNHKPESRRLLKEEEFGRLLTDDLGRSLPDDVSVARLASYFHDTGAVSVVLVFLIT